MLRAFITVPIIITQYSIIFLNFASPFLTGNFKASTLSCLARWDWFLSRWIAKSCPLSFICVSLQFRIAAYPLWKCENHQLTGLFYDFILCRYQRSTTAVSIGNFINNSFLRLQKGKLIWIYASSLLMNPSLSFFFPLTVAPICYAHLAAAQIGQFMKFEDFSETSSGQRSMTSVGSTPVPELPRLHENVEGSMFFCWGAAERLL